MCEVELFPGLVSAAESLQYPPIWPQRDSGKACLRGESSEGIVWTIPLCQGSASLMQVRRFQSAQLLCLDSLCSSSSMRKEYIQDLFVGHRLVKRSDSGRDLFLFYLYCTQTHQVIQGSQVLQNTKSFLQIIAQSFYSICSMLLSARCLLSFFSSSVACGRMSFSLH